MTAEVASAAIPRPNRRSRRFNGELLRVAALLLCLAISASGSGFLSRVDHLLFDFGQRLSPREVAPDLVIVAIDDDSLDLFGHWPWPRERHVDLLHRLCAAKPALIVLDIPFSERSVDPSLDVALAESLAKCGNVVLPLVSSPTRIAGQLFESPPLAQLAGAAAGIGRIGVRLDEDGVARALDVREGLGAAVWPLLAEAGLRVLAKHEAANPHSSPSQRHSRGGDGHRPLPREDRQRVEFVGPPGSVPRVSFAQVLDGKIPPTRFAGKIVFVGCTAVALGDSLLTPVSSPGDLMPGVEVQANVLQAIRDGRLISEMPLFPTLLLTIVLAVVPLLWLPRLMPFPGLLASGVWVLALAAGSALLPTLLHDWFAPSGALLAGFAAYPLWSWRRLEAARRHLDQELRQLGTIFPDRRASTSSPIEIGDLSFEQRIGWVQAAQRTLYELEKQRSEALAFISHDLRAPLATVVCLLESEESCDRQRLLPPLRRALSMAQTFLWLARAEALDRRRMEELELGLLIEQAADELDALADQRKCELLRELPDEPIWITGDFELLERGVLNLLHNALTYAPEHSPIRTGIERLNEDWVRFWVENDGLPLSAEQAERLFQRFSSGAGNARSTSSTGLGLYFVRTVAERHGGRVGVECAAGRIKFWMSLPIGCPPKLAFPAAENERREGTVDKTSYQTDGGTELS